MALLGRAHSLTLDGGGASPGAQPWQTVAMTWAGAASPGAWPRQAACGHGGGGAQLDSGRRSEELGEAGDRVEDKGNLNIFPTFSLPKTKI